MRDERAFRAAVAALLVSALTISTYHRHRAERASEEKISALKEEGLPIAIGLRSSGLALFVSVIAYVVNPRWMGWSRLDLPPSVRWAGAGLGAACLPLAYWVLSSLGKNITPTVATRDDHELVIDGPYRWVRHPLYSVGTAFFVSLSLLAANWFMALASLVALVMLVVRLPEEEARLQQKFGERYRSYREHTGRLVPRLRR